MAQVGRLWHTSNTVRIPEGERLAQRLVDNSVADVVFFANSGGEANEAAVKIARRYHTAVGRPDRYRVITFEGAFHGRSLAMIAATGYPAYLDGFGTKVDGFDQVAFGDWDALDATITPQTAAIMIEPIQGEGGLHTISREGLQRLQHVCRENGLLLILDEIQSGVGRTGKFFAYEWSGIKPNIVTVAKGIGGGFPMGACLATWSAATGMTAGSHGTTFGGNPLAMAAGDAVLDILLADGFLAQIERKARQMRKNFEQLQHEFPDLIGEVRGSGLLQGFQTSIPVGDFVTALRNEGLIALAARENVVRFAPPLVVTGKQILNACYRIATACRKIRP